MFSEQDILYLSCNQEALVCDMTSRTSNNAQRHTGKDVAVVALSWNKTLVIVDDIIKRTSGRKHALTLQYTCEHSTSKQANRRDGIDKGHLSFRLAE